MKRRTIIRSIILPLILSGFLISCLTPTQMADQALAEGSYIRAIELSLAALREDPGDGQALLVLSQSWEQANSSWRANITGLLGSDSLERREDALHIYADLITIHTLMQDAGRGEFAPDPDAIRSEAQQVSVRIAKELLNAASALHYTGTRESSQQAIPLLDRAFRLDQGLQDTYSYLYDLALKQATVRLFIFTGPDTEFSLNGIRMIAHMEDLFDREDFVEVVRVPNRYAAPVDDDHGARDFARGHRADLMLHIEPDTTYAVRLKNDRKPLSSAPWYRETTYLEATGRSDLRLVLIDLRDDSIISDSMLTVEQTRRSDFSITAVLGPDSTQKLFLGSMAAPKQLYVQQAPSDTNALLLARDLVSSDGLDLPSWGFETGAAPAFTESFDLSSYTTLADLEGIRALQDHTFLLFDVLQFDDPSDGSRYYQFVYGSYLGADADGRISTSRYDREIYTRLKDKLGSRELKNSFTERFLASFYDRSLAEQIVQAAAVLL